MNQNPTRGHEQAMEENYPTPGTRSIKICVGPLNTVTLCGLPLAIQ